MQIEEAIEYLKNYKYDNEVREAIDTVLNELEKKDAKIERLKNARDNWKKTYYQAETEIKKKDAVIDEMAEYIIELIKYNNPEEERDKEEIKEYFYKKVKEMEE